ncbi:MAG: hypothetical protein V3S07_04680 [Micropepsaceae bacterium]
MTSRLLFIVSIAVFLNACGVKNDLEIPNAQPRVDADLEDAGLEDGRDPSRPPQPLGL